MKQSLTTSAKAETYQEQMPPRWQNPSLFTWIIAIVFIGFVISGLQHAEITLSRLTQGVVNIGGFLSRAFPPETSRTVPLLIRIRETFEMALIGTTVGVILSLPIALLGSRNTSPYQAVRLAARGFVTTLRTIPELVWALIFVISVGLGSLAGILTIVVDTIGFAGRFFSERIEEIEPGPSQALESTGASRIGVITGSIIPLGVPSFVGTSLYAVEKAVRSAVVLGLVGAGGIGIELSTSMSLRRFDEALMIMILILVIVLMVEQVSSAIRKRFI